MVQYSLCLMCTFLWKEKEINGSMYNQEYQISIKKTSFSSELESAPSGISPSPLYIAFLLFSSGFCSAVFPSTSSVVALNNFPFWFLLDLVFFFIFLSFFFLSKFFQWIVESFCFKNLSRPTTPSISRGFCIFRIS